MRQITAIPFGEYPKFSSRRGTLGRPMTGGTLSTPTEPLPACWRIPEWSRAVSISRAAFYTLVAEHRPRSVKIGKRHVIIEAPAAWLERMAKAGGALISRKAL